MPLALKEGCVFKRKDGRWCGKYCENGKQVSVYAGSRVEAVGKVNEKVRLRDSNAESQNISRKIRLSEWVEEWIAVYKKGKLKESSLAGVRYALKPVLESLGRKQVNKIAAMDIEKMLNEIEAPKSRKSAHLYLRECLGSLVKSRVLKENPCSFVDVPKVPEPTEKQVPTQTEMEAFLETLESFNERYSLFARFLAETGLRKGEALALDWADIDEVGKSIKVWKAYDRVTKAITTPKTQKSVRNVPLFPGAESVLAKLKRTGKPLFWFIGRTANAHNFKALAVKCGIPSMTLHTLRHVFTTRCRENGVDPKVVSLWDGHSNMRITDHYSHITQEYEQSQTRKMAKNGR